MMADKRDPAWLVALSRRSEEELRSLPPHSQPAWFRVRVYEPSLSADSQPGVQDRDESLRAEMV